MLIQCKCILSWEALVRMRKRRRPAEGVQLHPIVSVQQSTQLYSDFNTPTDLFTTVTFKYVEGRRDRDAPALV